MKLTGKQKRFCEEYLIDLNATQAAVRAGYKQKTARSQGQRLLTNVDIQRYIAALMQERSARTGITADDVIRELRAVAMSDAEIKGSDKVRALELLGKHLGMFDQQTGIAGEAELPALYDALTAEDGADGIP